MLSLPFVLTACASSAAVEPPPREASASAPPAATSAVGDATSHASAPASAYTNPYGINDSTGFGQQQMGYPEPRQQNQASEPSQASTASSDKAQFPDRRAVEALDVLIATGKSVKLESHGAVITMSTDDLFETGTATLLPTVSWRLDDIASALALQSGRDIAIRVYTDSLGSREESTALSLSRAKTLRDYVVSKGAHAEQIHAEGWGPQHPIADNDTQLGRHANRRVEIVITTPEHGTAH
jgi:outer membrane protein OmpA-like peptidoglycan-associated protein